MENEDVLLRLLMRIAHALEAIAAGCAVVRTDDTGSDIGPVVEPNSSRVCPTCGCRLITSGDADAGRCPACGGLV